MRATTLVPVFFVGMFCSLMLNAWQFFYAEREAAQQREADADMRLKAQRALFYASHSNIRAYITPIFTRFRCITD